VIATAFHGLSVREVDDLRGSLREAGGQFQVVKNTLARGACDEAGAEALLEYLQGQTALVWAAGDAAAVAKALNGFAKATENRLSMKGGILDGAPISGDELKQLASLPSRDELLARLVGGVASPLQGTANALNSLLSGMARALGESAPLLMIGMVAFIVEVPQGVFDPATALPVQVFLWSDLPERGFVERTSGAIIVLLLFLIVMNATAVVLRNKFEKRW